MTKAKYRRPAAPRVVGEKPHDGLLTLAVHKDVQILETMPGRPLARRMDVFALLHERKSLDQPSYEAVRRLERDMDAADGGASGPNMDRVDCDTGAGSIDRSIAARARVQRVLVMVRPGSRAILEALLGPQFAGILTRWRDTVEILTGQTREEVQTDRVKQAAENLAEAYQSIDYQTRATRAA